MTLLDRAAGALRASPSEARPAPPTAAVLAALQAAGGSLLAVLLPVVLGWLATSTDRASWSAVLRLGTVLWLLGQRVPVEVTGGAVSLAPLGLLAICAATLVAAARRMARMLDPLAERIAAGGTRSRPCWPGWAALAMFVAGYAALTGLAAVAAGSSGARPDPAWAIGCGAVLATGCGLVGAAGYVAGGLRRLPRLLIDRLPDGVRAGGPAALAALAVQLTAGAVLLAAALAAQHDRVAGLYRALDPGLFGGGLLTVGQLLVLPNLAVWAAAFLAGPGFMVGTGTSVTPAAVTLGELPAVPVFGALPAPGALPGVALLLVAVPFLAGAVAGLLVVRIRGAAAGRWSAVGDTVLAGVGAGAGLAVLGWLAGGGIGPGRLGATGPRAIEAGAVFAVEVMVGALVAVGVRAMIPTRQRS
jgi:hypothetical protein